MRKKFTDRQQEQSGLLAYHLEEAGQPMEAAQAYMRSALWIGTHDAGQALRTWRKVHQLLTTLPASDSTNFLRMQSSLQILGFGWREGMTAEEARMSYARIVEFEAAGKTSPYLLSLGAVPASKP